MYSEKPPGAGRGAMNRRSFLKLGAAGIAGAVMLGSSGGVLAQVSPGSDLRSEVRDAARQYDVPEALLLAMGYVNTRLEMPPPEVNAYRRGDPQGRGAYGVMQLVENPSADTLGEASLLTGISREQLKADRRSNILGGAALLAISQGRRPANLGAFYGAVDGAGGNGKFYRAVSGIGSGDFYADQVFRTLQSGASVWIKSGEYISFPAFSLAVQLSSLGRVW